MKTAGAEDKWAKKGGQKLVLVPTAEYASEGRRIEEVVTNSDQAKLPG